MAVYNDNELWEEQESSIAILHSTNKEESKAATERRSETQLNEETITAVFQNTTAAAEIESTLDVKNKYAYAFLMAGCSSKRSSYRGYLYNILVSRYILRQYGSKADVVVLVRMSTDTMEETLPSQEENLLRDNGIIVRYLAKARTDSFYTAMLDKFQILDLTQYRRVIFMDSDAVPLCNLDYLFYLSDENNESVPTILKENLVLAWKAEPAQGGFFMLTPGPNELAELIEIIRVREEKAKNLSWPPFDEQLGWGHVIQPPDFWETMHGRRGTNWNFYGVFADQGLLYHWVKYQKQSVSIVKKSEVQNWGLVSQTEGNAILQIESRASNLLEPYSCSKIDSVDWRMPWPPYRDFHHFVSRTKPWLKAAPPDTNDMENANDAKALWFHVLRKVVAEYNMTDVNVENLRVGRPMLGFYPTWNEMNKKREADEAALNASVNGNGSDGVALETPPKQ